MNRFCTALAAAMIAGSFTPALADEIDDVLAQNTDPAGALTMPCEDDLGVAGGATCQSVARILTDRQLKRNQVVWEHVGMDDLQLVRGFLDMLRGSPRLQTVIKDHYAAGGSQIYLGPRVSIYSSFMMVTPEHTADELITFFTSDAGALTPMN